MKCSRCGRRNKAGAIVCRNCGAALMPDFSDGTAAASRASGDAAGMITDGSERESAVSSKLNGIKNAVKEKAKANRRPLTIILVCIIAAAIAAAAIAIAAGTVSVYLPGASSYTVLGGGEDISVLYRGKAALPHLSPIAADCSADAGSIGVIDERGMLYCCHGGSTRTVDASAVGLDMADSGKYLLYTDGSARLWAYDCKKKDALPVCICSEAVSPDYAVSSDGKCVVYTKSADGGLYLAYVKNGKEIKLGQGYVPVSVSNGAKQIYAYKEDDCSLYMLGKNGSAAYIRGGIGPMIYLNYDHSEIVFTTEASNGNVKTMLYRNGREYEVGGMGLAPVLTASMRPAEKQTEFFKVVTCPRKSFDGTLFYGDGLLSFGFKGSAVLNSGSIYRAVLSDNSKHLYFTEDGSLYHAVSTDFADCEKLYDNCLTFAAGKSGAAVWFVDSTGSLFCCTGTNVVRAAADVECFAVSPDGKQAVFVSGGNLFMSRSSSPANAKSLGQAAFDAEFDRFGMYFFDGKKWQGVTNRGKLTDLDDE